MKIRISRLRPRLLEIAVLAAVCGAIVSIALEPVVQRLRAIQQIESSALWALWTARRSGAMQWSPRELERAERAFRAALIARRIQETRWWPLQNFSTASQQFERTRSEAQRAAALARQRREESHRTAEHTIARAAELVESGARYARTIRLPQQRRTLLIRARLALEEARVLQRNQDHLGAVAQAEQARALAAAVQDHAVAVAARYANAGQIQTWERWERETVDWSRRQGRPAIVVYKEDHRLTLYDRGRALRTYRAEMGPNWVADKLHAGDNATPEGRYHVIKKKADGATRYHKALLLDYPNSDDRRAYARARKAGQIPASTGIGDLIEIHGEGGRGQDWTRGCVALTNQDIDDLFRRVAVGTPVTIIGGDGAGMVAEIAKERRPDPGAQAQP